MTKTAHQVAEELVNIWHGRMPPWNAKQEATDAVLIDTIALALLEREKETKNEIAKWLEDNWGRAYSEKIFPEVSDEYIEKHANVITGASGRMGRTLVEIICRELRAEAEKVGKE